MIYLQTANCYLRKKQQSKTKVTAEHEKLLTGLISGLSYLMFPNLQMISLGVTTATQYWWRNINESDSEYVQFLLRFPIKRVTLALGIGYMFHKAFFYPQTTTNFAAYIVENGSAGK